MKIKMLKSVHGSLDGVSVVELVVGEEYDTVDSARGERLARYHVGRGDAELVTSPLVVSTEPLPARRRKRT